MIENTKPEQSALKLGQLILQFLVEDTEQFWLQIVKRSRSLRKLVCLRLDWFEDDWANDTWSALFCCLYIHTYIHFNSSVCFYRQKHKDSLRLKGLNSENPLLEKVTPFQHQVSGARLCFRAGGTGCRSHLTWFYLLSLCCSGLTVRRKLWISTFSPALAVNIKRFLLTSFLQDFHLYFTFCQTSQIRTGAGSEVNSGLSVE